MKIAWSCILCLLVIQAATAFKDLFKPRPQDDKPGGILDMITKPKIPGINIQLGSHFGAGSFGFGFGFGGQFLPSGTGVNYPPKETVNMKPDITREEEKKEKVGPRPNWGEGKDDYSEPGSFDVDTADYSKPGSYEEEDYPKPGSLEQNKQYPKPARKDSLPDWEDIGEKDPKSENLMNGDLVGDGLIQPRLNRRQKRRIESRVFHVPLLFQSNAKPYQVKVYDSLNSLTKGNSVA